MTSRERVERAINHQETGRIPLDLGSALMSGIQASPYAFCDIPSQFQTGAGNKA